MPRKVPSIIGNVYGKWTVIDQIGKDISGNKLYKCRCECGTESMLRRTPLVDGYSTQCKSCGCRRLREFPDLSGTKIGDCTVLAEVEGTKKNNIYYLVRCDCGNEKIVAGYFLRRGTNTKCPQCRIKRHGMSYTTTYNVWKGMLRRCNNPNFKSYKSYGARGITVCDRWLTFDNFYADMGDKPTKLSIDRINNDGNYEPSNCRWATSKQQSENKIRRE